MSTPPGKRRPTTGQLKLRASISYVLLHQSPLPLETSSAKADLLRAGRWHYLEYPAVNTAGSYLFEPAAATHAFFVPPNSDEITMMAVAV